MLTVDTPLGRDAFGVTGFSGRESISSLFDFRLDLVAPNDRAIPFEQIVGQPLTVTLTPPSGTPRYFNGVVSRLTQGVRLPQGTQYRAEVVPWLWFLTRNAGSRIFQQKTVPDILRQLLSATPAQTSFELTDTHFARDYCVQYRESDFDFVSRLMEEEGIWYFFRHEDGKHTLVLADAPRAQPGIGTFPFDLTGAKNRDRVFDWQKTQELRSGRVTVRDFEFELPQAPIEATATIPESVQAGQVAHRLRLAGNERLELYDYPGGYAERFDGVGPGGGDQPDELQNIFRAASQDAGIRIQVEAEQSVVVTGGSTVAAFTSGRTFALQGHFNADGSYLLTDVTHAASQERRRLRVHELVHVHPRWCPVPSGAGDAQAGARRLADRDRRRPGRRGDLHRQVRPCEGAVPLGPRGQEGREQLVLDPRRRNPSAARDTASSGSPR